MDIAELDRRSELTKEWFVNDTIGNTTITDSYGISQTLICSMRQIGGFSNTAEDDCGNTYGSFDFSIQYNASLSPMHIMININGSSLSSGFYLKLTYQNLNTGKKKSTTYDFIKEKCRDDNANITFLKQITISNKEYNDVLEIDFIKTYSTNDIKTIYYAKAYGIIKFIQENGNTFEVQ
jgi:hypothetical protein